MRMFGCRMNHKSFPLKFLSHRVQRHIKGDKKGQNNDAIYNLLNSRTMARGIRDFYMSFRLATMKNHFSIAIFLSFLGNQFSSS
jgi:hypothetical protein